MSEYLPLPRKYRPQTFAEVRGQATIVQTLQNAIKHNKLASAYLFEGFKGTGKTTLARILAKAINCTNIDENCEPCNNCPSCQEIGAGHSLDVLEIDGASNRGIEDIRRINETIGYLPSKGKYKVYLIDEVHMLTKEAFNALLKTLEEPPSHVKFFFATTEAHKIPPTIVSRCQRFSLKRIPLSAIVEKLTHITKDLGLKVEEGALPLLAKRAGGCMRDAEALLDQMVAFHEGTLTATAISEALGIVPRTLLFELDKAAANKEFSAAFELAGQIYSEGKDLPYFIELLLDHYRSLLLTKQPQGIESLDLTDTEKTLYTQSASLYTEEQCLSILDFLIQTQRDIRTLPQSKIALETILLRIIRLRNQISLETLIQRLQQLEGAVQAAPQQSMQEPLPKPIAPPPPKPPASIETPPTQPEKKAPPPTKAPSTKPEEKKPAPPQQVNHAPRINTKPEPAKLSPKKEQAKPSPKPEEKAPPKPRSHYDTLLQFSAVELEGKVIKNTEWI